MKMGYVITCNGTVEHIYVGPRADADRKMEKMRENNRKAMKHLYEASGDYDEDYKWEVKSAPVTITRADEL